MPWQEMEEDSSADPGWQDQDGCVSVSSRAFFADALETLARG